MRNTTTQKDTGKPVPGRPTATRPFLEVAAVVATGALHLVLVNAFNHRLLFIGLSLAAWTTYITARIWGGRRLLSLWGFRCANFGDTLATTTIIAIFAAALMAAIGVSQSSLSLRWHMVPLLVLYPIWGLVQQFLVQALVAGNMTMASHRVIGSAWTVTLVCSLVFGLVHLPDLRLAACTFLLGLAFTPVYLRWRNLWPLGIYHGWLGVLFYFWVLRRDPWLEVFGNF